ncbi:MAG: hypothetical protein KDA61_00345, partial [Planctomycetales bacterium]|nr:hypothetical protein [Planctomycetales bacterium]
TPSLEESDAEDRTDIQRLQAFLPAAVVAVDIAPREREVRVNREVDVAIDEQGADVVQRLNFDVRYQPLSEIALRIPADLASQQRLRFELNGVEMQESAVQWGEATGDATSDRTLLLQLPRAMQGDLKLALSSRIAIDGTRRRGNRTLVAPLIAADQEATQSRAVVTGSSRVRVAAAASDATSVWEASSDARRAPNELRLQAEGEVRELALVISDARSEAGAAVLVERTWLQSWIAGNVRQDRTVMRFWSASDRVRVQLPDAFRGEAAEVRCDGKLLTTTPDAKGNVEIACGEGGRFHTLELRSQTPLELGDWQSIRPPMASIAGANDGGTVYWQIVAPAHYAALLPPEGLTPEYRLGWRDFGWGRQPVQEQADLERWLGAVPAPAPSPVTSRYVYSGFALSPVGQVALVRRAWLLAGASCVLFLFAGIAYLTGAWRRTSVRVVATAATLGALAWRPEAATAGLEATVIAATLLCAAMLLRRMLNLAGTPRRDAAATTGAISTTYSQTQQWSPGTARESSTYGSRSGTAARSEASS